MDWETTPRRFSETWTVGRSCFPPRHSAHPTHKKKVGFQINAANGEQPQQQQQQQQFYYYVYFHVSTVYRHHENTLPFLSAIVILVALAIDSIHWCHANGGSIHPRSCGTFVSSSTGVDCRIPKVYPSRPDPSNRIFSLSDPPSFGNRMRHCRLHGRTGRLVGPTQKCLQIMECPTKSAFRSQRFGRRVHVEFLVSSGGYLGGRIDALGIGWGIGSEYGSAL